MIQMMRLVASLALLGSMAQSGKAPAQGAKSYEIGAPDSKCEIQVSREGFLKAFGHDHLVSATRLSGRVDIAGGNIEGSSVSFSVATDSLRVLDPGEAEKDRQEVQATMLGEKVLDAAKFPEIRFDSTGVKLKSKQNGIMELEMEGNLSLHGVRKSTAIPVRVKFDDAMLVADGEAFLLQSEYGITPVKVGGGAVRVKDKLKITFHLVAVAHH